MLEIVTAASVYLKIIRRIGFEGLDVDSIILTSHTWTPNSTWTMTAHVENRDINKQAKRKGQLTPVRMHAQ
jgi:hypothetical protein